MSTQKGVIYNPSLGIRIEFQYNPEEIEEEKGVKWHGEDIQGMVSPLTTFQCGDFRRVRMRLFLDAYGSSHPDGHIAGDLNAIRTLAIPYDNSGLPTVPLPQPLRGVENRAVGNPGGVPPLVKIAYGGHVYGALISRYQIREVFHGITEQAKPRNLPVRAWVDLEFIVVDDYRMLADFSIHNPGIDSGLSMEGMSFVAPEGAMSLSNIPGFSQIEQAISSILDLGQSFTGGLSNMAIDFWNLTLGGEE